MRSLRCLTLLLLFVFTVPATAGGAAPPTLPVAKASRGTLYLGGNRVSPPYALAYRDGKLVANGLGFAPQPTPRITPANDDVAALATAVGLGQDVVSEGRAKGWSNGRVLAEWQDRARRLPHIASVTVSGRQIEFVSAKGIHVIDVLPDGPTHAPANPDSVHAQTLRHMAEILDDGGAVFVTPDAYFTAGPTEVEKFKRAVEKTQRGSALSSDEVGVLPEVCQKFIRNPASLVRVP